MKLISSAFALAITIGFLTTSELQAKRGGTGGSSNPHWVQLVDDSGNYSSPTLTSKGLTTFPDLFSSGALDRKLDDFNQVSFADTGVTLCNCQWTIHSRGGNISGVTFFFTTCGRGIHRTDKLPVTTNGTTIEVQLDDVAVWKEKGGDKGTVAGYISVGNIVYTPVNP